MSAPVPGPAPAATADESLPRRFGRYLLFDRIGRGGMANIYLARVETEFGAARRVVVKEILPALSGDAHFARMLVEEAKLVAGLRHGNIAQVLDLGREDERLFIAMEYVEGFDLNQLLRMLSKRKVALPAEFALFLVREMLAALDFAHRAKDEQGHPLGIVHRDVSPSNVLVSFEGEVKLCDFGIAKAFGTAPSHPNEPLGSEDGSGQRSRIAGKAAYMSPEHARGEELDARADIFAAGIVLWELCAGRRLYRGTEDEMLQMAREGAIPPLPDRGLPLHDELAGILSRALVVDPNERWASAGEMARALDDYAMRAKLFASQIRFGTFLSDHFELDVIRLRRARERAAEALDRGPAVELVPLEPAEPAIGDTEHALPEGRAEDDTAKNRAMPALDETQRRDVPPAIDAPEPSSRTGQLVAAGVGLLLALAVAAWLLLAG